MRRTLAAFDDFETRKRNSRNLIFFRIYVLHGPQNIPRKRFRMELLSFCLLFCWIFQPFFRYSFIYWRCHHLSKCSSVVLVRATNGVFVSHLFLFIFGNFYVMLIAGTSRPTTHIQYLSSVTKIIYKQYT